jgi:hypothetical protein
MTFSHMVCDLSFTRLLQFNSNTEKFVPGVFRECPQMNISRNSCLLLCHFLECYHREGDEFLDHIITGDETWVLHYAPESKRQYQEWHHAHSPTQNHNNSSRHVQLQKSWPAFFGIGKAFFSLTSCPVERPLMQTHIVQH